MSMPVAGGRRPVRTAFTVLLVLALLVPTALFFVELRRTTADDLDRARTERQAVAYLRRLVPLLSAATDAQANAVQGRGPTPLLDTAASAVTDIDQEVGTALGTHERWDNLRRQIAGRTGVSGGPAAVFQAHVEITDLILALCAALRDNSGLGRDPDNDVAHLQQAVAVDLPQAVVSATRAADLALVVDKAPAQIKPQLQQGLAAAALGATAAVNQLTEDLQRAADDTRLGTLSSSLLGVLDVFRRAMEAFTLATNRPAGPSIAALGGARADLRNGLTDLGGTILNGADAALSRRIDDLHRTERVRWGIVGGTALVAVLLLGLVLTARRRVAAPDPDVPADGWPPREPADTGGAAGTDIFGAVRERSGALR